MGMLDALIYGVRTLLENGTEKPLRSVVNLIGATVVDNPTDDRLDVTISGTGILSKLTLVDQPAAPPLSLGATVLGSSAGVLSMVSPLGARRTWEAGPGVATRRQVSDVIGSPVRTTTATPTLLLAIPVPVLSVCVCEIEVVGMKPDATGVGFMTMIVRVLRGNGAPVGPGAHSVVVDDDGLDGFAVADSFSGSEALLTVTGPAATTVDWVAFARVVTFTP